MKNYDIAVIGGGFSGCAAALAAARNGASVILIERINALGGAPATMFVNPFMRNATIIGEDTESTQLSQGIFKELVGELRARGAMFGNSFNPEYLKLILNRKMREAGVDLLFNSYFVSASRTGGSITEITVANKSGLVRVGAKIFIDCTGDADVAFSAGFPTRHGRPGDGLCQPMTLCFLIGNVDTATFDSELPNVVKLWLEEKKSGNIKNPMDGIMLFHTCFPDIIQLNATRIVKRDPVDCFDITEADIEAREQMFELLEFLRKRLPSCAKADILASAVQTGVRESRMIDGEYTITSEELVACARFPDAIAAGNYDIDIHNPEGSGTSHYFFPKGEYYTIPYRALIPKGAKNLLVAGRCISATHEAQASVRIMPIVCTLGEAAGTAAALAAASGLPVAEINTEQLRETLRAQGAFLGC